MKTRTAKVRVLPFLLLLGALAALGRSSDAASPADPQPDHPPMSVEVSTFEQEAAIVYGLDTSAPEETAKLVFVHHSCGSNWLDVRFGGLGDALGENNYHVSDTSYGWGPADVDLGYGTIGDHTDIGHWYNWFAGPNRDTYVAELYTTTSQIAAYTRPMPDPGGENEIILFKSCYPNSHLGGEPNDPPTDGENPLRGQDAGSEHHTVGNAKGIYNELLAYLRTRQDKLFVVITAPPLLPASTSEAAAANARAFNNWLVNEWLADYPYHNVAVFDFYNVLTTNGGDPDTNDYGLATGNHHRVITSTIPVSIEHKTDGDDDEAPNYLEYATAAGTNNHPSTAGNRKATGEFVPLLNAYYHCWKHGNCLDRGSISLSVANDEASISAGDVATYSITVAVSETITAPVTLTLAGTPERTSFSFVPDSVDPPASSRLYVTSALTTAAGTYPLTITATAAQVTATVPVTLVIYPVVSLGVTPTVRMVAAGEAITYTVSVSATPGLSGPVSLAVEGAPSGATAAIDPSDVVPPGSSQLSITTTDATRAGTYPLMVTAATGQVTTTAAVTLVIHPVLTVCVAPAVQTVVAGEAATYTVSVSATAGLSEPISLVLEGAPSGTVSGFEPNPVGTPGTSLLSITSTDAMTVGTYVIEINASSGALRTSAEVAITVLPVLSVDVSPAVKTIGVGDAVSYTVGVTASTGFTRPVLLALEGLSSEMVSSFDPSLVAPPGSSQLHITTTLSVAAGTYGLTVTAAADDLMALVDLKLVVVSGVPSFALDIAPTRRVASPGQAVTYTCVITGMTGSEVPTDLSIEGLPPGTEATWSSNPVLPGDLSVLTVYTGALSPLGHYRIWVAGTAAGDVRGSEIELVLVLPPAVYLPVVLR